MHERRDQIGRHESSHGIDLAPMLDFVINLLIFFIITAVFIKECGLTVNRPTSIEQTTTESKSIQILENGDVLVDNLSVDLRAVRAHIEQMRAVNPASGVLIIAKETAPTGILVEVVDQVHLGGVYDITFSTSQ